MSDQKHNTCWLGRTRFRTMDWLSPAVGGVIGPAEYSVHTHNMGFMKAVVAEKNRDSVDFFKRGMKTG